MITFETLRWKNFLSTGNDYTQVDFVRNPTTLIIGHNGAGKSTLLDALSFALFGKAHRKISKAQLVNTINNKACTVEVQFSVAGQNWRVVRGIKPNIFEIWKGDSMINQSSHANEYQKILEQNIIKLNHKSFHQIVVLGSSSFIPFMQLSSVHRRDVIEDLLDINVFSKMNQILKEKTSSLKEQIKDVTHLIDLTKTKIDTQRKYIRDIKSLNEEAKTEKYKTIDDYREEIRILQESNASSSEYIEKHLAKATARAKEYTDAQTQLADHKTRFITQSRTIEKETKFFETNDQCPSCSQDIEKGLKAEKILAGKGKIKILNDKIEEAQKLLREFESKIEVQTKAVNVSKEHQNDINTRNKQISQFQKSIDRTQSEIDNIAQSSDISKANTDLDILTKESSDIVEKKLDLNEQFNYNMVIGEMLRDTGIKTKIVKQYLPVINKLVNQYLQVLDFYVSFHLDEAFSETIRSRHRDAFTYDSFSEGEKQRIDLALLFTWRQIAKMKNSVSTNLLILDETFDSSLDYEGVDNLMKIIYALGEDTNVFVISHKGDILDSKFSGKIEFHKEKNFSRIKKAA